MKLIHEGLAIGAIAAQTCTRRISTLDHKVFDDTMEYCAIVVALHAKLNEIATGTWSFPGPQINFDFTIVGL